MSDEIVRELVTGTGEPDEFRFKNSDTTDYLIRANDGNDLVRTGSGDDFVAAGKGDDRVFTGDGDDYANGGDGNDMINGGSGNDRLSGGEGNDRLFGGVGSDRLQGGSGNDLLVGGIGDDSMAGGEGRDTFRINMNSDGNDVIHDFEDGIDKLDLDGVEGGFESLEIVAFSGETESGFRTGTQISIEGGSTITLYDIDPSQITSDDFFSF